MDKVDLKLDPKWRRTQQAASKAEERRHQHLSEEKQASAQHPVELDFELFVDQRMDVALLTPHTDRARVWLDHHIDPNAEWMGSSLPINLEYLTPIMSAIEEHGFKVVGRNREAA